MTVETQAGSWLEYDGSANVRISLADKNGSPVPHKRVASKSHAVCDGKRSHLVPLVECEHALVWLSCVPASNQLESTSVPTIAA